MPPNWETPFLEEFVLVSTWQLPVLLAIVAALIFIFGGRRGSPRLAMCSVIPLLMAVAAAIVSRSVETEREQLMNATIALAEAAKDPWDEQGMIDMISQDFRFGSINYRDIRSIVIQVSRVFAVNGYTVTNLMARSTGETRGETYLAVFADMESTYQEGPIKMQWMLSWRRERGEWRLFEVTDAQINNRPAFDEIIRYAR